MPIEGLRGGLTPDPNGTPDLHPPHDRLPTDLPGSPPPGLPGGRREQRGAGDDGTENRLFVAQTISSRGAIQALDGVALPINEADRMSASHALPPSFRTDRLTSGTEVRIVTASFPGGGAVQVARSLEETNETLSDLRNRLLLLTIAVIIAAIAVGLLLARRATASLEALTKTAERVAESGHPDAAITVTGTDEIGRLGRSLQQMLASLLRSREQQQRLIQDAGHELRTPLTSLRTNIAVLGSFERLSPEQRLALTADLRSETDEMAELVEELVELSIGGDEPVEHGVDLTRIAQRAASRVQRRRGRDVHVTAEQIEIDGQPRALDRAIGNLLDNAMKFDSGSEPIELTLAAGRVEVADRGPGIPEDQLDLIFNRFHRAVEARNVPGSGLGLSIVSQVAAEHGGSAYARNRPDGGAVVGFTFSSF